ncbi:MULTISPECIES: LysR family transcriptional regulator [Roseobacteraceae]|uniref:LysR family transcriptional regulator n=1 Tax=Falsiruegeria litorea TaxID=1280831 RepID=A0ABS5X1G1_9RHOB|nr:LysR family transcriptional regulator [Falsiruegeria litorea]MBT3143890.1 LysR family transcriptional regulator [Falsiruegeria litorea]MBT8168919.1 LysR family transcriptional regulator [Falsiruegeria litorea]
MPLRFTLRQLEYFVAVGEAGTITLAADRVNVSSPSISAAIAQLEQEFGLPLFVRQHAQGLSLTLAGRQMMVQAKTVLKEAEQLTDLAGDISGSVRGPLAIGCLVTFAQVLLPALRRGFEDEFSDVRTTQFELNQSEIFSYLRRADIDVALTYDLELPSDLKFVPLLQLPPFVIVNETHPLADLPEVSVEALGNHPMVLLDLPFSSDYFLSFFANSEVKPNIAERTRDMAVMRGLVANGFGYSIANVRPRNDQSPDGKQLKFIPLVGGTRSMRMGLLMSNDADRTNVVRAFVEHCKTRNAQDGLPGFGG